MTVCDSVVVGYREAHERLDVEMGGGRVFCGKCLAIQSGSQTERADLVDDLGK